MIAARALQRVAEGGRPVFQIVRRRAPRSVLPRDRGSRRLVIALATGIFVIGIVFFVLLEQVVLAQSAFRLERLRERAAQAEARHEELLLQAARLESPVRIEVFARQQLGMVDPEPGAIKYVVASIPRSSRFAYDETPAETALREQNAAAAAASSLP